MTISHERFWELPDEARLRAAVAAESSNGLALASNPEDNSVCCVGYQPNVPCIRVLWKGYATSSQIRFIHMRILHLVIVHRVAKLLADDGPLPTVHADDQQWIVENWIPRAADAGLRLIASTRPVHHFGRVSVHAIRSKAEPRISFKTFDALAEAEEWLSGASVPL